MVKRKKTNENEVKDFLEKLKPGESSIGTPPLALFPARNYHYRVLKQEYKITIPRSGDYHKLAPTVFSEEDGEFMLYDEESKIMYLPAITKVLFAADKYPDLKNNQLFLPLALVLKPRTVNIIGQVVEMLPPPTQKK